ncbi:MAG: SDR family NAD(P)-dependent oxidoreductase [Cytophagales bacterium]|nr:SDR family NAD(P)-dependent oxidoreductase [Cytophagales bacterium]
MHYNNKNIVITGAASGIGLALTQKLATFPGVKILATDINPIKTDLPNSVICHQGDISQPEQIEGILDLAEKELGQIDIFIANAGFAYYEQQQADWKRINNIFACNTFSPIYTAQAMQKRYSNPYQILITASFMGYHSLAGYALYSATKSALIAWADAYRWEKPENASISVLCPVATKTEFFQTKAPVPWPAQTAEQVANAAIKGLAKYKRNIFPSQLSQISRFVNWILPLTLPLYQRIEALKFKKWQKQPNN